MVTVCASPIEQREANRTAKLGASAVSVVPSTSQTAKIVQEAHARVTIDQQAEAASAMITERQRERRPL